MSRFVILRHEMPAGAERPSHWDLMLEGPEALTTWALEQLPQPGREVEADPLPDHRKAYLDYEGPVSGGRGTVHRWDSGQYERLPATGPQWCLRLRGQRLRGILRLFPGQPHSRELPSGELPCESRHFGELPGESRHSPEAPSGGPAGEEPTAAGAIGQRWRCGFSPDDDLAAC